MAIRRAFRSMPRNAAELDRLFRNVDLPNNEISDGQLRDSVALSVMGRASNSDGDPADITAASNGLYLGRRSNALAFQQIKNTEVFTDQTAAELAAGVTPVNYFYEPGNVLRYGTNTTPGTTDMAAAVRAACDVYQVDETVSFVYIEGAFYCASDVPDIHSVQLGGPGYVQVGTGQPWWAEPNETNSTFAAPMQLCIDPAGSDSNSGLSSVFPLLTLQAAANILMAKAPLMGFWRISLAAGTYTVGAYFDGLHNTYKNPLYIVGPDVAAWDNTSPPANRAATGGSIPTAILDGAGDGAGWAIDIRSHGHARIVDVKFTDWGTKATRGDEGAIRARDWSSVRAENCHVWDCAHGHSVREGSDLLVDGGYYNGLGRYVWPIFARYNTGISATSAGDTEAEIVENCTYGVDVFEGGNGHIDYVKFLNNGTHINVRRGGNCVIVDTTFTRTTGTVAGVNVQDGGHVTFNGGEVWSGTHSPRVKRFNGGVVATETAYDWRVVQANLTATATSGTTETTIATYTLNQGEFVYQPAALKLRFHGDLANPNDVVTVRIKIAGVTLAALVLTTGAGTQLFDVDFKLICFSAASQHYYAKSQKFDTAGSHVFDGAQGSDTTDYSAADRDLTVTLQCANAADVATSRLVLIERMG